MKDGLHNRGEVIRRTEHYGAANHCHTLEQTRTANASVAKIFSRFGEALNRCDHVCEVFLAQTVARALILKIERAIDSLNVPRLEI
jgi:hypothetical protein